MRCQSEPSRKFRRRNLSKLMKPSVAIIESPAMQDGHPAREVAAISAGVEKMAFSEMPISAPKIVTTDNIHPAPNHISTRVTTPCNLLAGN